MTSALLSFVVVMMKNESYPSISITTALEVLEAALMTLIFGYQISKGVIYWPVKVLCQILNFGQVITCKTKCFKFCIILPRFYSGFIIKTPIFTPKLLHAIVWRVISKLVIKSPYMYQRQRAGSVLVILRNSSNLYTILIFICSNLLSRYQYWQQKVNNSVVAIVKSNQIINSFGFYLTGMDPLISRHLILEPMPQA